MRMITKNCVICGVEFLIKATGKRVPRLANFPLGTILRRKGCITCSRKCSKENVLSKNRISKQEKAKRK